MELTQLDTENADRNLTSTVTVLTDTPHATEHRLCQGYIAFGDGVKDLDGSGGAFELVITVGGQTIEPSPQTVTFSAATRTGAFTHPFPVPGGAEVILRAKSPNAGDTDVDVTAYLFDLTPGDATAANQVAPAAVWTYATRTITAGTATIVSPVAADNTLTLVHTTDYNAITGDQPSWTKTGVTTGSWDSATGVFRYQQNGVTVDTAGTFTISEASGTLTVALTLTDAETGAMTPDVAGTYEIEVTADSGEKTIVAHGALAVVCKVVD